MAASVLTLDDAKNANFEVIENGRGTQAVHDMVTAMRANRRSGTANCKTRADVAHSNKKPWRQKGTGRARAGRTASPIWRGGGVAHGPHPRSYAKDVNKRTKRLAFRKVISERIKDADILLVDAFDIADGKTKSFISQLSAIAPDARRTIIISAEFSDKTYLAGRNVANALLMTAAEVNVEHLLYYSKIIITQSALETLAARTAK
jgi:large subunit ribosomal protein L4